MEKRPTLEGQLEIAKMSETELIQTIAPSKGLRGIDFWIFCHLEGVWNLIHWNWFCTTCGQNHIHWTDERCHRKAGMLLTIL